MSNRLDLDQMRAAHAAGEAAANRLAGGDYFVGAIPAADDAEYFQPASGRCAYRALFVTRYLSVLHHRFPHGVLTDADNRVVADQIGTWRIVKGAGAPG